MIIFTKIFLTPKCPLNCVYCFKDKSKAGPKFKGILKKIDSACNEVFFKGGDPLSRKDILSILKYAKSKNKIISLQNSGLLLNKKILSYVDKVYFDFDTIDYSSWKFITRKSKKDYNLVLKNIMLAKNMGKIVYIDSLFTTLSYPTLVLTKKFCDSNGFILRIIENPYLPGFDYSNSIVLPINKARFLGKKNILYLPAKKGLLNKNKLKYYKSKEE